jgi:hypothetical protein
MHQRQISGGFAACTLVVAALTQGAAPAAAPAASPTTHNTVKRSPYANTAHSEQVDMYYGVQWGVDHLQVQRTSSGALVRFSYHVVDAKKAAVLHDKKAEPHLVELRSHAMLAVPTLENVGQLRQSEAVENGKEYWVLFSNKGNYVKVGSKVDVVIGDFYASGLTVR